MSDNAFVHVHDLRVVFRRDGQTINAVNGVSFDVQKGEVMALIGESGSGKSVTLRALMRLHPPGSSELSGTLQVGDDEVLTMSTSQLRRYRGGRCAMIFQEPLLAFDPVYTVGQQIIEGLRRHEGLSRQAARDRALEALRQVRIPSPERRLDAYPHEMSGGMRQRAMIALALSCNPQLLLADEPTTALDQINKQNVDQLQVAWIAHTGDIPQSNGPGAEDQNTVVGSSASSSCGLHDSARAIIARWRIPPDISCG